MTKDKIAEELRNSHNSFFKHIQAFTPQVFNTPKGEKWSPAQHSDHINKSVKPVVMAFGLPKLAIRAIAGKANRPSRTYDEVVEKYKSKIGAGGKSSKTYEPKKNEYHAAQLVEKGNYVVNALIDRLNGWTEEDLDYYVLPHPLLGKITAREMLYFTVYHVQHHNMLVERDYITN